MNKEAMYKLGYGLYVLTAKTAEGRDNGCIINTAIQVTTTPNRISICVNKANYTHDIIHETGEFNISIISEKADFELFKHFGFQTGREVDKFADYPSAIRSNNGIYVITDKGINSFISGKVVQEVDLGTHTMFIADVLDGGVLNQDPSATYTYYQSNIKPKPEKPKGKGWRCRICGYIYEGEDLPEDFVCPVCKHGSDDFEKIQ